MMAYNVEQFVEAAVRQVAPHVYLVVIVEGAWSPDAKSKRSTDRTIEIINRLDDEFKHVEALQYRQMNPPDYPFYQTDEHMKWMSRALEHPYYDPRALQQQLMARDWGLQCIKEFWNSDEEGLPLNEWKEEPGWLWIVDADEIYEAQAIDELFEFVNIVGDDYDLFTINGKNFYFNGKYYHDEWYRRFFKIRRWSFFSDDNSLEDDNGAYKHKLDIPKEVCEFYHYGYVGEERVRHKLEMWRQDDVEKWLQVNEGCLKGEEQYDGRNIHLFGHRNRGYANYKLKEFEGIHPLPELIHV
jgi:hypothetical protein